jgi:hypothetical protein
MSHLANAPSVDRTSTSRNADAKQIDRTAGRYGGGLIRGISMCSVGEALGHGFWIDKTFLEQLAEAAPTAGKLLKSRFTHPSLCSDGMGKSLGTFTNVTTDGTQLSGDLELYHAAHEAPDGDLAEYVMSLATEDPLNFGTSIVFKHDVDAETQFQLDHGGEWETGDYGDQYIVNFQSPDSDNLNNLPHARLDKFHACDVVDEPAANPKGLFHRPNELLDQGNQFLDYLLGQSKSHTVPSLTALGAELSTERVKQFVSRYLADKGLSVHSKGEIKTMPDTDLKTKLDDDMKDAKKDDSKPVPENQEPDVGKSTEDDSANDDDKGDENGKKKSKTETKCSSTGDASNLAKFCEEFGHEAGAKFFLAGTSFEAALSQHNKDLRAELADAKTKIEAFAKSGVAPVSGAVAPDKHRDENNKSVESSANEKLDPITRFAMANK